MSNTKLEFVADEPDGWCAISDPEEGQTITMTKAEASEILGHLAGFLGLAVVDPDSALRKIAADLGNRPRLEAWRNDGHELDRFSVATRDPRRIISCGFTDEDRETQEMAFARAVQVLREEVFGKEEKA